MSRPSRVRATGPLAPYAAGFRQELVRQGYTPHSASNQLQLLAHASRWLASRGLGVEALGPACMEEFLVHRRGEGYTLWLSAKAMGLVSRLGAGEPAIARRAWRSLALLDRCEPARVRHPKLVHNSLRDPPHDLSAA